MLPRISHFGATCVYVVLAALCSQQHENEEFGAVLVYLEFPTMMQADRKLARYIE